MRCSTARTLDGNYSNRRTCHTDSCTCDPTVASPKTLRRGGAAAWERYVEWGEALEDEWQTVPKRRKALHRVWEVRYLGTRIRSRFSQLDYEDEIGTTHEEYGIGWLLQTSKESSCRGKPAHTKEKESRKRACASPGAGARRPARRGSHQHRDEKNGNPSAEHSTATPSLRPDPHRTKFAGCDGPVASLCRSNWQNQQMPTDQACGCTLTRGNASTGSHCEWPTPCKACAGQGLGGDDAANGHGQAA